MIPLYNHARYVDAAVASVMAQGPIVREVIVVDDGSTDGSAAVVKRLAATDRRLVLRSQPNRGAHAAINAGIQLASGELVAILNSDDVYATQRIELLVAALDAGSGADIVASGIAFIDGGGQPVSNSWYDAAVAYFDQCKDIAVALVNANFLMTTSNYLVRRCLFDQIGLFAPLRYTHDLDFALRVLAEGRKLRLVREPLLRYRIHAANTIKETHSNVRLELAVTAAMYAVRAWDHARPGVFDWSKVVAMEEVWLRHELTKAVHLCMTYLRRHPTVTLERSPLLHDNPFRDLLGSYSP